MSEENNEFKEPDERVIIRYVSRKDPMWNNRRYQIIDAETGINLSPDSEPIKEILCNDCNEPINDELIPLVYIASEIDDFKEILHDCYHNECWKKSFLEIYKVYKEPFSTLDNSIEELKKKIKGHQDGLRFYRRKYHKTDKFYQIEQVKKCLANMEFYLSILEEQKEQEKLDRFRGILN